MKPAAESGVDLEHDPSASGLLFRFREIASSSLLSLTLSVSLCLSAALASSSLKASDVAMSRRVHDSAKRAGL